MRISIMMGALATLVLSALPAAAQNVGAASPDAGLAISNGVLWAAGIAGFVGFMLGSINPNDEYAASKFHMPGALLTGAAAAAFVGGFALFFTTGVLLPAAYAMGVGAILGVARFISTRPAPRPKGGDLNSGVNLAEGTDARARLKAAQKMWNRASFSDRGYYASRGREWFYSNGMSASDLSVIGEGVKYANSSQFDILVLLVKEMPGVGEPAVVVVRGTSQLRQVTVTADSITLPGVESPIPGKSIIAGVGYAWR